MTKAFLFPGQGSQYVGMGQTLYEAYPLAREIFAQAESVLPFSPKEVMFFGPEEQLTDTEFAQPCLLTLSYALFRCLMQRFPNQNYIGMAGHSLGEYSALVCAGALAFEDALRLVHYRGQCMKEAAEGGMAAIVGLSRDVLESLLVEGCVIANDNCPGQLVISGLLEPLADVMQKAKEHGAKLVKKLAVSGPFHSPWMGEAGQKLMAFLEDITIHPLEYPYYPNVTARITTDSAKVKGLLVQQITGAVRFRETLLNMTNVTHFYEVGPGKVLQGLVRRTLPNAVVVGVSSPEDLDALEAEDVPKCIG